MGIIYLVFKLQSRYKFVYMHKINKYSSIIGNTLKGHFTAYHVELCLIVTHRNENFELCFFFFLFFGVTWPLCPWVICTVPSTHPYTCSGPSQYVTTPDHLYCTSTHVLPLGKNANFELVLLSHQTEPQEEENRLWRNGLGSWKGQLLRGHG